MPSSLLAPAEVMRLQRKVGNGAVAQLLAHGSGMGMVQRHASHPPVVPGGKSARRQHWEKAGAHLRTLAEVTQGRDELLEALSHGEDAGIRGQLTAAEALVVEITKATTADGAKKYRAAKLAWLEAKKKAGDPGITSPTLLAQIQAKADAAETSRKEKLADSLYERGLVLQAADDWLHAAVQYARSYKVKPDPDMAMRAGDAFRLGGDKERAAPWYRRLLKLPSHKVMARTGLGLVGGATKRKFKLGKEVDSDYTSVTAANLKKKGLSALGVANVKKTGLYAEEAKTTFLASAVQKLFVEMLRGVVGPGILPKLGPYFRYNYGIRDASAQELFIQFARLQHNRNQASVPGWSADTILADVQRFYPGTSKSDIESGPTANMDAIINARVQYLKTSADREPYKLKKDGGLIKQGTPARPVDGYDTSDESTNASGQGFAIYVMNSDGSFYAASHQVDRFHHSSFLAGGRAAGAGEIKVDKGVLKEVSNKSGHYQPGPDLLAQSVKGLSDLGSVSGAKLRFHTALGKIVEWAGGPDDFVASQADAVTFERRKNEEVARQGGWK